MKHFPVETIVYSRYKPAIEIVVSGGSRPRLIFIHNQTNQKSFFKTYVHNPREVWAEALASHLGKLAGLPIQQVTIKRTPADLKNVLLRHFPEKLPTDWTPIGTMARNIFVMGYEITYGAAIVGSDSSPTTLAEVERSIRSKYYAPADILSAYADMIVFDAFIGNMDRHHQNWGVCESKSYKRALLSGNRQLVSMRHFAPLFDHGSSLMFELDEDKISALSMNPERLLRYVQKAKYGFLLNSQGNKSNVFEIIREEVEAKSDWGKRFKASIKKIVNVDLLDVATLIVQMPNLEELKYSQARKHLLYKSLLLRYNILNNIIEENSRK
jgi:hypothetical protein